MRCAKGIAFLAVAIGLSLGSADRASAQLAPFTYYQGVPKNTVNAASGPIVLPFAIYNTTTKKSVMLTAMVANLAAWPAVKGETPAQASLRKAQAVVAAINAEITMAITAGTLPQGTPMANAVAGPALVTVLNRFGVPVMVANPFVGAGLVTIPNATGVGGKNAADPSGEPAGGGFGVQGDGSGTPSIGTSPSMGGKGSSQSYSTGVGEAGGSASVSFGFFTPEGQTANCVPDNPLTDPTPLETEEGCPGDYISTVFTTAGETDAQVMDSLAIKFNTDFASQGYTLSYDPSTDILSFNGTLWSPNQFYFDDTDIGLLNDLYFQAQEVVPEPSSITLLGAGLIVLGAVQRRRRGNNVVGGPQRNWSLFSGGAEDD